MTDNYYRILGLENFASEEEIKVAYRKLAKKYHPDKNPDNPSAEEIFKRVSKAYQVLSNPQQKAIFDRLLENKIVISPHIQPDYSPRSRYYTTEQRKFTPTAWLYARIFVFFFVLAVIFIPLTLSYYFSIRAYERGIEQYEQKKINAALNSFADAIIFFGGKSIESAIKGAEISVHDLHNNNLAHYFIDRGMKYAEKQNEYARLYFLKAKAYQDQKEYELALIALENADSLNFSRDSVQLEYGLILAFGLYRYQEAEKKFDYLIRNDVHPETAWFGKSWCLQNLGSTKMAVDGYSKVIEMNPDHAVAYYYRGKSQIILSDTTAACKDFERSVALGYFKASDLLQFHCERDEQD